QQSQGTCRGHDVPANTPAPTDRDRPSTKEASPAFRAALVRGNSNLRYVRTGLNQDPSGRLRRPPQGGCEATLRYSILPSPDGDRGTLWIWTQLVSQEPITQAKILAAAVVLSAAHERIRCNSLADLVLRQTRT